MEIHFGLDFFPRLAGKCFEQAAKIDLYNGPLDRYNTCITTMKKNIVFLVDIQNGFINRNLEQEDGGNLYIPGSENVLLPATNLLRNIDDSFIVLSQDFHPANHISFASNHTGARVFSNIALKENAEGIYKVAEIETQGVIHQTLWPDHCIQGTKSALFAEQLTSELPDNLQRKLHCHVSDAVLMDADDRNNKFFVVRKGTRFDLDSYGIATENDGVSKTSAHMVFAAIADELLLAEVEDVNIYIGGLATNYCVKFSHDDIYKLLIPELNSINIKTALHYVADISAGVPDVCVSPGFEVATALRQMAELGTKQVSTEYILQSKLLGKK